MHPCAVLTPRDIFVPSCLYPLCERTGGYLLNAAFTGDESCRRVKYKLLVARLRLPPGISCFRMEATTTAHFPLLRGKKMRKWANYLRQVAACPVGEPVSFSYPSIKKLPRGVSNESGPGVSILFLFPANKLSAPDELISRRILLPDEAYFLPISRATVASVVTDCSGITYTHTAPVFRTSIDHFTLASFNSFGREVPPSNLFP